MTQRRTIAADLSLKVFLPSPQRLGMQDLRDTNGRIRQYQPKSAGLSVISYQQRAADQEVHKERPCRIVGWKSPAQCFRDFMSKGISGQS
jgi:IS30 family transposase